MLKDYFEVPNKPAIKSGNVLSCDFTDHETFIPQPLDFTRNTLATYVDCNGLIKVSGVSDTELVTNGDFSNGSTDWTIDPAWSIANGKAFYDETINSQRLKQNIVTDASKTYQIKFTISGVESGKFARFALWGISNASSKFFTYTQFKNGDYVVYASLDGPNGSVLHFNAINGASSDSSFYITNISLKEVDINVPRIDYLTEIGKAKELQKPSLLLEPQSTNLFTYSNNFAQIFWSKQNGVSITQNQTKSPEGIVNADKLVSDNSTGEQYLLNSSVNTTIGDNVTYSCFVKKSDYDYFHLRFTSTSGVFVAASAWYNISDGTVGTVEAGITAKIENYGNGWYRCAATRTAIGTGGARVRLQLASADNTANIVGDGIKGTFIYGAQYEIQPYCTSYIPTVKSATTRNLEQAIDAGSMPVFNSQEGTFYIEAQALHGDEVNPAPTRRISVGDDSNSNRATLTYTQANAASFIYKVSGVNQFSRSIVTGQSQLEKMNKFAFTWKTNEFKIWNNGVEYGPRDTSGITNPANTFNEFSFTRNATTDRFYARVREVKVFRRVLTDAELTELTNNIR